MGQGFDRRAVAGIALLIALTAANAALFGVAPAALGLAAAAGLAWALWPGSSALRRQRDWVRTTLASIGDAVATTDTAGNVTYLNPVAEALTGWSTDDASGRPLTEVFHIVNEGTRKEVENPALRALKEGVIVGLANHTLLIARDGVERPIDDSAAPIKDGDGGIGGAVLVFRDITERKKAEEAQARLAAIVASSDDAIVSKTLDGTIRTWNAGAERIFGHTAAEAVGQPITLIIPPERLDEERGIIERLRRGERVDHFETVRVAKNGRLLDISLTVSPVRDAEGRVVGASKVARDVTQRKLTEENLARVTTEGERRKRLYEAALNNTPDLVYVFDLGHRFIYANDALLAMWGKRWDEAIGRNCLELGYPAWHAEMHDREIEQVKATRKPIRGEVPFAGTFGRRIYDYILVPVLGADGEVEAVAGTTRDVTDHRAMEAAVRAADERYRALVAAIDQGFCVVEVLFDGGLATDYRFLDANPAFQQQTGLSHPVGRTIRELAPGIEDRWVESYARVATTGEPTRFVEVSEALGRWWDVFASRVGGPGSRTIAILFSDITARRVADAERERLLREVETERGRLAEALRTARMCAWDWDPAADRVVASDTAAAVYGLRPGQALDSSAFGLGLIHPEDADRHRELVRTAAERGESWHVEFRIVRPVDGRVAWLEERATARRDGRAARLTGLVWDVTERKRAELELRDADRKKDDFIALLAHELRNPLAPIRNGLQVIRMAATDADTIARSREMMDRQLTHMVRMVDDLLDVSRIGRHKMELRRTRISLAEVAASAVETARPVLDEAGHELTISLPAAPVFLDADLTRLAQVFSNLLTNSAKYTPRGGRVWLSAERTDGHVLVSVRDTGVGIPKESLPTVFDMFSQVDRPIERSTGGLGIGLALVRGLVEMHGGTVTAASEGPGRGSTFTVTLSVLAGAASPPVPPAAEGGPRPAGCRVLVVDDNRDGAESLAEMLRLLGHEARTAHDGVEAVEQAEAFRPEVILMDVGMPQMNGLEATRRIREQPWGRGVAVIALTGWGQENDRERSREAGCDGHLVKPVDLADLQRALADLALRR